MIGISAFTKAIDAYEKNTDWKDSMLKSMIRYQNEEEFKADALPIAKIATYRKQAITLLDDVKFDL